MNKNLSIVLRDYNLLSDLCGVNDQNLRLYEDLLGIRLFLQGNEIFLETENKSIYQIFKSMLDELEHHVKAGRKTDPEIVRAIHDSLHNGKPKEIEFLQKSQIVIPKALRKVFPKNYQQALYLETIEKNDIIFSIGPAGTGKTYLAVACALKTILSHNKRKLIVTRPVVETDESLGFLPGDLEQKIQPYLRPIYDSIESIISNESVKKLIDQGSIEIAPLAYMRGRTLADAFIILDEAQNTTKKQMLMFLTRIGNNSRVVITGDITQIDLPNKNDSGLIYFSQILKSIEEIKFIYFTSKDVVRNRLVRKIINAYENTNNKK